MNLPKDTAALAKRLLDLGYLQLFQGADEKALDTLWNASGAPEALTQLAADPEAPAAARFIAAEILFSKHPAYPAEEQKRPLAAVYARALAENLAEAANTWGLPGLLEGFAGEHVLALGEAAVPEFAPLLDDNRRVYYEGSQEATLGNSYGYRVKDLAAFYISKIKDIPLVLDEDFRQRDQGIDRLKRRLGLS